jgi:hypothetical protein
MELNRVNSELSCVTWIFLEKMKEETGYKFQFFATDTDMNVLKQMHKCKAVPVTGRRGRPIGS